MKKIVLLKISISYFKKQRKSIKGTLWILTKKDLHKKLKNSVKNYQRKDKERSIKINCRKILYC